ncbi:HTH_Tnp_Tc3_2 domain-containing protein [Trichonephila clavipes]|nr:HTH_Tnp_Tc3_2 domain-containing protein [Trichonephila clavipes]
MNDRRKISDRANFKGQLALALRGKRWLRRIVPSQRSQILAQITTQLNDGASRTVSKWTVQYSLHRMGFGSNQPMKISLLNDRHHVGCAREQKDWNVEDWKHVALGISHDFDYLTQTGGREYCFRLMKPWMLDWNCTRT